MQLPQNLDVIVHIGAGRGAELPLYRESSAKQIVLVEPNPRLAEQLRQLVGTDARIQIVEEAITTNVAANTLTEYNLPEASSLYPPTGLRHLFPGLKVTNHYVVNTLSPAQLLQDYVPLVDSLLLVIQAPGAEQDIIEALVRDDKLRDISNIWLYANEASYGQDEQPIETVIAILQQQGYSLDGTDCQNTDWPVWQFSCNPLSRKLDAANTEIQQLMASMSAHKQELKQASQQQQQLESANYILKAELDATSQALAKEQEALATANSSIQDVHNQLNHRKKHVKALEEQLALTEADKKQEIGLLRQQLDQAKESNLQQSESQIVELHKCQVLLAEAINQSEKIEQQLQEKIKSAEDCKKELVENQNRLLESEAKIQNMKAQLVESQEEKKAQEKSSQEIQEALKISRKDLEYSNQKLKKAQQQLSDQERKARDQQQQILQLNEKLEKQARDHQELGEIKQRMEYLFGQHSLQLEQAANALGRHVTTVTRTTAKELEAGIALQQQYGQDLPELEEQGNRLPATVALQLSRQLKTQPYDLIIEMGSGVTTSFIAHTLRNTINTEKSKSNGETQVSRYIDPSEDDLTKRIVCFEHNRTAYNKLQDALKQSGLAPLISLQFSPLVPYTHQGQEHLFYDCANRLQQIAQLFEDRQARIFILLNQPQGESQPEQAFALPKVLQYLSSNTLDMVINVSGDTPLLQAWHQLLDERGLEYKAARDFGNSQVQLLTINP